MLPRSAVIYIPIPDLVVQSQCIYVAQCSGMKVVRTVVETDRKTNDALRAFLEETWSAEFADEVVFPYTLIMATERKLVTRNIRNLVQGQVIGFVITNDVLEIMDDPNDYDFPVCPNLGQSASTHTHGGHEAICPHLHDGSADWDGVMSACKFSDADDPICPHRPGFDQRYAEYKNFVERTKRINYRRLNLHFFDLRQQYVHGSRAESNDVNEYRKVVYLKMCEILDRLKMPLTNSDIAEKLSTPPGPDEDGKVYFTSVGGDAEFEDYTISKLLANLGKQKEWREKVRGYGPCSRKPSMNFVSKHLERNRNS
jgi:hypothetical protein